MVRRPGVAGEFVGLVPAVRGQEANEQAAAHAELIKIERQIRNIAEAVKAGMLVPAMKDKLVAVEVRKARLVELTRDQAEEPLMLHPGLADVSRRKVEKLTQALDSEGLRVEAAPAIRLVPKNADLEIELVGEIAGILPMAQENRPRPRGAGRDNQRWLGGQGTTETDIRSGQRSDCRKAVATSTCGYGIAPFSPRAGWVRC
jgi:hypothetical protein